MRFFPIVWANLWRHRMRTILTTLSVTLALFLFASLRSIPTSLEEAGQAGSETRMVVRNATGIVFPLQMSYASRLEAVPGVSGVAWASWFGGWYRNEREFFGSFATDIPRFLDMYPEIVVPADQREEVLRDRTAAIVGVKLMERYGWQLGQTVTLNGTIYPGDWRFTIRGAYTVTNEAFDELSFVFHYEYLYEQTQRQAQPGWFYLRLGDPDAAATVAVTVDEQFRNSSFPTRTETERAFQAGFISMFGNVQFLMSAIGIAVVFAILLVTGNAMMMSARERTGEVAVLKALGYEGPLLIVLEMAEATIIAVTGALLGLGGARLLWDAVNPMASFIPGYRVNGSTLAVGAAITLVLALVSGFIPAYRAWRLSIVQALRTVE